MLQRELGRQAQQDVQIGQAEVGVHDHHPLALLGQGEGEAGHDVGLADASLAGGDGHHTGGEEACLGGLSLGQAAEPGGLIVAHSASFKGMGRMRSATRRLVASSRASGTSWPVPR